MQDLGAVIGVPVTLWLTLLPGFGSCGWQTAHGSAAMRRLPVLRDLMAHSLLERQGELARIDDFLARTREGRGRVLVVPGPAGIGKSSLLAAARERALLARMRVLSARGVELEGGFSFGVARQLLERLVAESTEAERAGLLGGAAHRALIALDDPGSSPVGPGDPPFAVVHGLY